MESNTRMYFGRVISLIISQHFHSTTTRFLSRWENGTLYANKEVLFMAKIKYKNKPEADTTLASEQRLVREIIKNGWERLDVVINDHKKGHLADVIAFKRSIKNPLINRPNNSSIFPQGPFGGKRHTFTNAKKSFKSLKKIGTRVGGQRGYMGVPPSISAAHAHGLVPSEGKGKACVPFESIMSVKAMRSDEDAFVIGFDTEFYYVEHQRYILSWQFAFIDPNAPNEIQELIVFSANGKTLSLSMILAFIVEHWAVARHYGNLSEDGYPYYLTRRWDVPVINRNGDMVTKRYLKFDDAVNACCDSQVTAALQKAGPSNKCNYVFTEGVNCIPERTPVCAVNGYGIGYINDFTDANKQAIPITLVCHSGTADLSTLCVDALYEEDIMKKLSSVQGGLVTLKDCLIHTPQLTKYWNVYSFRVSVRDTLCYAPAGSKSLKSLGETIGVPKLEVMQPYTKDNMLQYMTGDILSFCDYAVNDAVIALLYCGELWGYNKSMPITVMTASARVAVPVIAQAFGLSETDTAGFERCFRGLHRVKKGLSAFKGCKSGYIDNTSLEPVSDDARILQEYARNAYKGGFNGCFMPGFYTSETYDYDLENAYPTCMALIPDVDWDNPIAFEFVNTLLTRTMINTPFEPIFGYVTFEFPHTVKVPCIPVSIEGSLIYPYTSGNLDGVYASAPELWLALQLGAKVQVKRLYVGTIKLDAKGEPSRSLFRVMKQLIGDRNIAKQAYGEGSVMERLIKDAVNGIYGKIAQDVIDKHTWSAMSGYMENIGGSRITSPVHACLTTAGVRAVLIAALNEIHDLGYNIYSVTTDGFISDVPENVLNSLQLYGLARFFRASRTALTGSDEMWAMKHLNPDLLNLTTRGNASLEVGDKSNGVLPGVMAHNSYVTGYMPDSYEDRVHFMHKSMTRLGRMKTTSMTYEKFKNLAKTVDRTDFSVRQLDRFLSMDFDLKRKPLVNTLYESYLFFDYFGDTGSVACFDTEAYETPEEFIAFKKIGRSCTVLRTVEDWKQFFNKIAVKQLSKGQHITDLEWSKLVSCIMAYRLGIPIGKYGNNPVDIPYLSDSNHTVREKIDWINTFNRSKKKFTENTWKDCRKQTRVSQILPEDVFINLLDEMIKASSKSD
jgi:hypothetical protein